MQKLFDKARIGESRALQAFFDKYAGPILAVIRANMNSPMRSEFDSDDFLQQTRMKLSQCNFADNDFETPQAFLAYMMRVAEREVLQVKRKFARRTKGGVNHEKPIETLPVEDMREFVDHGPAASEVQIAEERWQRALAVLAPGYRYIATRLRDGFTQVEIAKETGLSERTIRRVLEKLRKALLADEEEEG